MSTLIKPKKLPNLPGVYIFRGFKRQPLYIGKAANIKSRVAFYFRKEALNQPRMAKLMNEARSLEIIKTDSEIEALIKESSLIKKYRPKYNILMRDDKNYLFVVVTKEYFPRLILTHQPKIFTRKFKIIGPFTETTSIRKALLLLRRAFPYCVCSELHKKSCLNAEMERCPGYCCIKSASKVPQKAISDYWKNIKAVISILEGKKISALKTDLKKQITRASGNLKYEEAAKLRDRFFGLNELLRHREVIGASREEKNLGWQNLESKIKTLIGLASITRVEGYDVSNISGVLATGSMVVFTNGVPDKNEYRKFRIKTVNGANDVAMMTEVIIRRLAHRDWNTPNLIILDGGKPQLNTVLKTLKQHKIRIAAKITALAKHDEELYIAEGASSIKLKRGPKEILHFFQRVRDEAHRFAKKYHHKLRTKLYSYE